MMITAADEGFDQALLRQAFGCFPSGVTAFCGMIDGKPEGMTASSFTSVSIDPALVSVCVANTSSTWPKLASLPTLGLSVLSSEHGTVARSLAAKGVDRFAGIAHDPGPCGPILKDAVGWIDCAIREEHDAGDHTIVVASVSRIEAAADTAPLVFYRGVYGTFRAAAEFSPVAADEQPRRAGRR